MSRLALGALALAPILLAPSAPAQADSSQTLRPIAAQVRDAGTLHAADGSWTRRTSSVSLGSDVLYDNTCSASYVRVLGGDTLVDEGRLPSTTSPNNLTSRTGCASSYAIQGFQIAYCTDRPTATFACAFYSEYTYCTQVGGVPPVASITLAGLPGSHGAASFCWTVDVDTSAAPFVLSAGDTGPGPGELFGWSISSPQPSTAQGPLVAGDANVCSHFDGTSWDSTPDLAESGTGMGARDAYVVAGGGPSVPGCYWFQGEPFASFWLELYGDTCAPDASGQEGYCYPNHGVTVACPCAPAPAGDSGCRNSTGLGAILVGSGVARLSADSVVLSGSQMPSTSTVLYFQGTLRHNAGQGEVFGDGVRCAGGQLVRLGTATNSAGASQFPSGMQLPISAAGHVTSVGTRTYQAWYRNVAPFCTPAPFNTTNGWEIFWGA